MKKRFNFRSFCVSTAAVLLLSLVLTALPFTQRITENTLYVGFRFGSFRFACRMRAASPCSSARAVWRPIC